MWLIESAFAGAWAYVFHWGTGIGVIALCLAGIFASSWLATIPLVGPWLAKVSTRTFIEIAVGVSIWMGGMWVGNADLAARRAKQDAIVDRKVDSNVEKAKGAKPEDDPYNRKDN